MLLFLFVLSHKTYFRSYVRSNSFYFQFTWKHLYRAYLCCISSASNNLMIKMIFYDTIKGHSSDRSMIPVWDINNFSKIHPHEIKEVALYIRICRQFKHNMLRVMLLQVLSRKPSIIFLVFFWKHKEKELTTTLPFFFRTFRSSSSIFWAAISTTISTPFLLDVAFC